MLAPIANIAIRYYCFRAIAAAIEAIPARAKVFEIIMKMQLLDHLFEANNLFSDAQHGFRRGRLTTIAVISLAESA